MRRSLALAALLSSTASIAAGAQQDWPRADPPQSLLTRFFSDLAPDEELVTGGRDQLSRSITVRRYDLNRDGVGEWVIEGTRYCGTNCRYWIYHQLGDGGFRQVYAGGGVRLEPGSVTPRSRGWVTLVSRSHMSAYESFFDRWEFTGSRYQWRSTEYRGETNTTSPRLIYQLWISDPHARARHLDLSPVDAGGGLKVAARYRLCSGPSCAGPELILRSVTLPAGRTCVRLRTERMDGTEHRASDWCGDSRATEGSPVRELTLNPSAEDWARLRDAIEVELSGPGLPGRLDTDAAGALLMFASRLADYYTVPCVSPEGCRSANR